MSETWTRVVTWLEDPLARTSFFAFVGMLVVLIVFQFLSRFVARRIPAGDARYRFRKGIAFAAFVVGLVVVLGVFSDKLGQVTIAFGLAGAGVAVALHYLAAAIFYLFQHRPEWPTDAAIGKTLVSSRMIDRVAEKLGRRLHEVPVGFKWFVDGLLDGSLGFGGEESAGASFLRRDGSVWTTDKDGMVPALLAAEITARAGRDPGEIYRDLTRELGEPAYDRVEAPATAEQKAQLGQLSAERVHIPDLAGEPITAILTRAPGNDAPIGGLKVTSENGWFAARPSGTEDIYKIYAESFRGAEHLRRILEQAQTIVSQTLASAPSGAATTTDEAP